MASTDSDLQTDLRKRARRRLLGAIALALTAAIVLPVVMDHEPRPPAQDISVRIPPRESLPPLASPARVEPDEPDEPALLPPPDSEPASGSRAVSPSPGADGVKQVPPAPVAPRSEPVKPDGARTDGARTDSVRPAPGKADPARSEAARPAAVARPDNAKPGAARPETPRPAANGAEAARATAALEDRSSFALQLGVFSDAANVAKLRARAKDLGYSSFTEEVKLADGQSRTRVKVGPFPNRAAAEAAQRKLEAAGLRSMLSPRP
ncbi:SPOR domain-containing protein [Methyloversatilis thermotolerans]|uniref:SPOR domain-containing protein n=1 Tax=Methyloversatilis thermotolerans TaxID=1346290 RepID=UPI00036F591B|nr:SPOR domain-containing protein [Methyloversatilis thermotolerans]